MTPTALLLIASTLYGLAVGSFLNVVVYRVPEGRSLSRPGSACPECKEPIGMRDNIPLVSWLVLRGRCRHCGGRISPRYPAVEVLTGAVFVAVGARYGWSWTTAALDVFSAGLIALACIDLERLVLPRRVVYPTALASGSLLVVATFTGDQWARLGVAVACSAVAFGLFWLLNRANPRWLGFGDVRLAGVIGLVLGWLGAPYLIVGLLVANVVGIAVAAGAMALGRMRHDTPIPYGTFLALGSLVAVLAGTPLTHLFVPTA